MIVVCGYNVLFDKDFKYDFFLNSPDFTSAIFLKMAVVKTNVTISQKLRQIEQQC